MKKIIRELEWCLSYRQRYQVLKKYGRVHKGSSRMCLVVGNKVIKVARNERGYLQNECEYNVYFDSDKKDIKHFAKIYAWCPSFTWIIQEKVSRHRFKTSNALFKKCDNKIYNVICRHGLVEAEIKFQMGYSPRGVIKCYDYGYSWNIDEKILL